MRPESHSRNSAKASAIHCSKSMRRLPSVRPRVIRRNGSPDVDGAGSGSQLEAPITRANHFVPQGLLRRWSSDRVWLPTYRLLVPDARVPLWAPRPIKSLAMRRDLYTDSVRGLDSDETERWFANEIELPGLEASERLIRGRRLGREDWHAVIRLYALQELRTPQSFVEQMRRWDKSLPKVLRDTLHEGVAELERSRATGRPLPRPGPEGGAFNGIFKIEVQKSDGPEGGGILSASVTTGRRLWIAGIKHVLENRPMEKLLRNHWAVLIAADGYEWPLTDHPALRLGFRSREDYTFAGGWGRRDTDLVMPLSPHHLLHSQVGRTIRGFRQLSEEQTRAFRSFLLKRAHRVVFATRPMDWISRERPRLVDRVQFELERQSWEQWHEEQARAESETS